MEWTKCESCGDHTSIGSYLFQIGEKKFPEAPEKRVCLVCGNPAVVLFQSYDALLNELTDPAKT